MNNNNTWLDERAMLSGFFGIILVITSTDNNSPHKVWETEAKI
jgi:hypothetical protein